MLEEEFKNNRLHLKTLLTQIVACKSVDEENLTLLGPFNLPTYHGGKYSPKELEYVHHYDTTTHLVKIVTNCANSLDTTKTFFDPSKIVTDSGNGA